MPVKFTDHVTGSDPESPESISVPASRQELQRPPRRNISDLACNGARPRYIQILALLLGVAASASAQSGLQRILDTATTEFPGRAGIWVKHLTSGEEAGTRATETFNSASVIKIPVLVL